MSASIFISHSAKDPQGRAYLKAIVDGLSADHDVWVDEKRLATGDHWGLVIANQFVECHGAIALFSSQARESEYFRFEVDNLFARWMREGHDRGAAAGGRFRFCPLLVPPLTVDEVKAYAFASATYLGMVNWTFATSPDDAVARVRRTFDGLTAWPSPLEAVEGAVKNLLRNIKDPAVLFDAARAGGFGPGDLPGGSEALAGLARLYMRCPIDRLVASLRQLETALDTDQIAQLFDLLSPSWVPFEGGQRLDAYLSVTGRTSPAHRFAIISGDRADFTPLMYLMRALRRRRGVSHVIQVPPPPVGQLSAVWLQDEVVHAIKHYVVARYANNKLAGVARDLATLDAAVAARDRPAYEPLLTLFITRLVSGGGAVLVAVPAGPGDFPIIQAMSEQPAFAQVTFVALRGRMYETSGNEPHVILPEVTKGQEELAYNTCADFF